MYSWNTCEFSRIGGGPTEAAAPPLDFLQRGNVGEMVLGTYPASCLPLMFLNAFTHLLFMLPVEEVESLRSLEKVG